MKSKTIVCQPTSFDSLFQQWYREEVKNIGQGHRLAAKIAIHSVQHEGETHYILYTRTVPVNSDCY